MGDPELRAQIEELEEALSKATPAKRLAMWAEVNNIIAQLRLGEEPLGTKVSQVRRCLASEGDDDFFENMPV